MDSMSLYERFLTWIIHKINKCHKDTKSPRIKRLDVIDIKSGIFKWIILITSSKYYLL